MVADLGQISRDAAGPERAQRTRRTAQRM